MAGNDAAQPIKVVMFGGGPTLERGVKEFLCRLEDHPEIALAAAFCQSSDQSLKAVAADLWQRRRFLAIPLLLLQVINSIGTLSFVSRGEAALNKKLEQITNRIHFVPDIHAAVVLNNVRTLEPDLGLIYGSPILKPHLFEIPASGTLGIHHGKVPKYRGKKTTFWALYNGEQTAGVTIQKVNRGLDTGAIVKLGEVPAQHRSLSAVWHDLEQLGLDLYIQAILEVKNGTATYQPQVGKKGKLYRDPGIKDILSFWQTQISRRLR